MEDQDPQAAGSMAEAPGILPPLMAESSSTASARAATARSSPTVEPGKTYVDKETGEEFEVVGAILPLAPSPSNLPWSVENLRLCGCSLEQLAPRDVNDCPHCGRRLPAVER